MLLKSIAAVVAGFITVVALNTGTDYLMEHVGIFPEAQSGIPMASWMLFLALMYRILEIMAGGYVTAALAPNKPMKHVIILGCFGVLGGIAGIFAGWNLSAHWYPIALAIAAFPYTWLGGKLYEGRK